MRIKRKDIKVRKTWAKPPVNTMKEEKKDVIRKNRRKRRMDKYEE